MATDRLRCLGYAKALEKAFRPETVHKLRTHLRRLQSYAEYLDRPKAAERLGEAVSWFSRLRTLDEFQRYLRRLEVGAKDWGLPRRRFAMNRKTSGRRTAPPL